LALVRDEHVRPATALLCSLDLLEPWTSGATSKQLEGLQAAWNGSRVLVVGESLPPLTGEGVLRYSGRSVLVPLGYRLDPPLFEEGPALREAFRLQDGEFARLELPGERGGVSPPVAVGRIGNPSHNPVGRIGNPSHNPVGRIANPSHQEFVVDVLHRSALGPLTRAGVRLARRTAREGPRP
jgi:hypothetical protein